MNIEQVREIVEQATYNAFWTAAPEGFVLGLATGGYIIWRLSCTVRALRAELRYRQSCAETSYAGLSRLARRTSGVVL